MYLCHNNCRKQNDNIKILMKRAKNRSLKKAIICTVQGEKNLYCYTEND